MGTTDMYDIERRFRQCRQHDGALRSLALQDSWARVGVIDRGSMTSGYGLANYEVDSNTILGVYHYQTSQTSRTTQHTINRLIIDHEGAWVGHQQFKGRHTLGNHLIHRRFWSRGKIGDRDVKAIIDNGLPPRFTMPGLEGFSQAMPALLISEIDDGGGATTGGCYRTRLEVIAGNSCRQRQFYMCMHINSAREDIFSLSVKYCVDLQRGEGSRRTNCGDLLILDEYVT